MTEFVRLPCGHLRPRPEKNVAVVECKFPECGKVWKLILKSGEWTARDVESL